MRAEPLVDRRSQGSHAGPAWMPTHLPWPLEMPARSTQPWAFYPFTLPSSSHAAHTASWRASAPVRGWAVGQVWKELNLQGPTAGDPGDGLGTLLIRSSSPALLQPPSSADFKQDQKIQVVLVNSPVMLRISSELLCVKLSRKTQLHGIIPPSGTWPALRLPPPFPLRLFFEARASACPVSHHL